MFYPGKGFLGSDHAFATSHTRISPWCSSVLTKTPLLPQVHSIRGNWGAEIMRLVRADEGRWSQRHESLRSTFTSVFYHEPWTQLANQPEAGTELLPLLEVHLFVSYCNISKAKFNTW